MDRYRVKLIGLGGELSSVDVDVEMSATYGDVLKEAGLLDTPVGNGDRIEVELVDIEVLPDGSPFPVYDYADAAAEGQAPIASVTDRGEAETVLRNHYRDSGWTFARAELSFDGDFYYPAGLAEIPA